ncbi:hypothetical protein ERC79_09255 [Rhodococcus sp. ABRD24]|nr:hypothetical protein ERC79_09255 [Rhodococcus sp. ABRD24]
MAHAQDSVGGGSLPASGSSFFQAGSAETISDAIRFNRTFTEQEITKCREDAEGDASTGLRPCPVRPITEMDLAVARLLFGSGYVLFGSMG